MYSVLLVLLLCACSVPFFEEQSGIFTAGQRTSAAIARSFSLFFRRTKARERGKCALVGFLLYGRESFEPFSVLSGRRGDGALVDCVTPPFVGELYWSRPKLLLACISV